MRTWRSKLGGLPLKTSERKKWTQEDVYLKTGIPGQTVSEIENGSFDGALSILEKYMLLVNRGLEVVEKTSEFPQLDELNNLFGEDND
jgi:transcriptional regulator with XRE-family HTH domain